MNEQLINEYNAKLAELLDEFGIGHRAKFEALLTEAITEASQDGYATAIKFTAEKDLAASTDRLFMN